MNPSPPAPKAVPGTQATRASSSRYAANGVRVHPVAAKGREGVEGTAGWGASNAGEAVQGFDQEAPPPVELLDHLGHAFLGTPVSGHCAKLRERVGAGGGVLVRLEHVPDQPPVTGRVAQAPAVHGVSLGEPVDGHCALEHAGQAGDARVVCAVVDLVREDEQLVLETQPRQRLHRLRLQHGASRVVGTAENQHLRTGVIRAATSPGSNSTPFSSRSSTGTGRAPTSPAQPAYICQEGSGISTSSPPPKKARKATRTASVQPTVTSTSVSGSTRMPFSRSSLLAIACPSSGMPRLEL